MQERGEEVAGEQREQIGVVPFHHAGRIGGGQRLAVSLPRMFKVCCDRVYDRR